MRDTIEAVLDAAWDVFEDTEGPRTPAQARLALALNDYDPKRFPLGLKDTCTCDDKGNCDECHTEDEARRLCQKLAALAEKQDD